LNQHSDDFQEVSHTADVAFRIHGSDFRTFLIHAARGVTQLMGTAGHGADGSIEKRVELTAFDRESLLVDWLSEILYWAETEQILFQEFNILKLTDSQLTAVFRGRRQSQLNSVPKAVTYHNLEIVQTPDGLHATIVLDV